MPNIAGIRNVPWQTYLTTVDAIEALTGYDLLANLPDKVENIVEAGIKPPIAVIDGPYSGSEGSTIAMSAAASLDPNGTVVSYAWDFGDGATGTGPSVTHTYAQDGIYTVTVTVTDNDGLTDNIAALAAVANVAPVIAPFAGATLLPAETYTASGSFTDPGADPWTATVDYGDGSGPTPLALSGRSFTLAHVYSTAGVFTVTVSVSDDHVTTTATQTVTVTSQAQAIRDVIAQVDALAESGAIRRNLAIVLDAQLDVAAQLLEAHVPAAAAAVLNAVIRELEVFTRVGQISATDAQTLRTAISRIVTSINATSGPPH
jgi:PKD repeat protein